MKRAIVALSLMLTLSPLTAQAKEYNEQLKTWMKKYAVEFNVDPTFVMAVAHIESRVNRLEFRVGPMGQKGKFYGPMGIHRCYLKLGVDDPEINIKIGARALRGVGDNEAKLKQRLKTYNTGFDLTYWYQVRSAISKYRKEIVN